MWRPHISCCWYHRREGRVITQAHPRVRVQGIGLACTGLASAVNIAVDAHQTFKSRNARSEREGHAAQFFATKPARVQENSD